MVVKGFVVVGVRTALAMATGAIMASFTASVVGVEGYSGSTSFYVNSINYLNIVFPLTIPIQPINQPIKTTGRRPIRRRRF